MLCHSLAFTDAFTGQMTHAESSLTLSPSVLRSTSPAPLVQRRPFDALRLGPLRDAPAAGGGVFFVLSNTPHPLARLIEGFPQAYAESYGVVISPSLLIWLFRSNAGRHFDR